jgi:FkbM family methyltransferase
MFKEKLLDKISQNLYNNFGRENFDELRFGSYTPNIISLKQEIKNYLKKQLKYKTSQRSKDLITLIKPYLDRLEELYKFLNTENRDLLISIISYRLLGFSKVKLPRNNEDYWKALAEVKKLKDGNDTYDPHFMHFILEKFNLKLIGYDIKFYFSEIGTAIDFILEQYSYKRNGKNEVAVKKGDIVFDIGGCWGDTALYFAHKTDKDGQIYSFEFIPENIKLHNINTNLNPELKTQIKLISHPVSDVSDCTIYFKDNGPGSTIKLEPFKEQTGNTTTISIDDFVVRNNIKKVDFIKMDIEGAEPKALLGAIETIKKFRPKLAIAIYHSLDDLVNIPLWIHNLNLDYEIFIDHFTIHAEETICFAKPKLK